MVMILIMRGSFKSDQLEKTPTADTLAYTPQKTGPETYIYIYIYGGRPGVHPTCNMYAPNTEFTLVAIW